MFVVGVFIPLKLPMQFLPAHFACFQAPYVGNLTSYTLSYKIVVQYRTTLAYFEPFEILHLNLRG